jgi:hypothetical protein
LGLVYAAVSLIGMYRMFLLRGVGVPRGDQLIILDFINYEI